MHNLYALLIKPAFLCNDAPDIRSGNGNRDHEGRLEDDTSRVNGDGDAIEPETTSTTVAARFDQHWA